MRTFIKSITVTVLYMGFSFIISAQNVQWVKQLGGTSTEVCYGQAIDDVGNIYTVGYLYDSVDFDPGIGTYYLTSAGAYDFFISKLDNSGNFLWAKRFGSTGLDLAYSVAVDLNGNVFTTGQFSGTVDFDPGTGTFNLTANVEDVFVSKLDSAGNFVWARKMGGSSLESGNFIAVDLSGNVYTLGTFSSTFADFDPGPAVYNLISFGIRDVFISKLDSSGNFVWAKQIGGPDYDNIGSLAFDASGNIITMGIFKGTADFDPGAGTYNLTSPGVADGDNFVAKLDTSGNFLWAKQLGGPGESSGGDIKIDASGNMYTSGAFMGTIDVDPGGGTSNFTSAGIYDFFVLKLDVNGNLLWAKQFGDTLSDFGASLALDASGNIFACGRFSNTIDVDPGPGIYNLTSAGGSDLFIARLDTAGNFLSVKQFGGPSDDLWARINIDNFGNIYAAGTFGGTVAFEPGNPAFDLTSFGLEDIFVFKMSPVTTGVIENYVNNTIVYPNPTSGEVTILLGKTCSDINVIVRNMIGQELFRKKFFSSDRFHLMLDGEPGIYFIEINSDERTSVVKVLK